MSGRVAASEVPSLRLLDQPDRVAVGVLHGGDQLAAPDIADVLLYVAARVELRLSRSDSGAIDNLGGWLTTAVARVCLDMLRSRRSRREEPMGVHVPEAIEEREHGGDPEHEALIVDSVGLALLVVLVVLETLTPAERLAFVLHDMFAVPFDEIAPIVGRSPTAARRLASRARRRVQGASTVGDVDAARRRQVVNASLAASRAGDFGALLALLDPSVVLRADPAAVGMGTPSETRGAQAVAGTFSGRARVARLAVLNGVVGGCGPRAAGRASPSDSRSKASGSWPSTSSPTPCVSASFA